MRPLQQNVDLSQLRDGLFARVLLLGHSNVLSSGSTAYAAEGYFSGADHVWSGMEVARRKFQCSYGNRIAPTRTA